MAEMDIATLRRLLTYDAATGRFYRKWDNEASDDVNRRQVGREALSSEMACGHRYGRVNGVFMYASRAAWAITHGYWPKRHVQHMNGRKNDNRLVNLYAMEEVINVPLTEKHRGIWFDKSRSKWRAYMNVDGKQHIIGNYRTLEEAKKKLSEFRKAKGPR